MNYNTLSQKLQNQIIINSAKANDGKMHTQIAILENLVGQEISHYTTRTNIRTEIVTRVYLGNSTSGKGVVPFVVFGEKFQERSYELKWIIS